AAAVAFEAPRAQPVVRGDRLFTTAQNKLAYCARRGDRTHALAIPGQCPHSRRSEVWQCERSPALFFRGCEGDHALDVKNGHLIWQSKLGGQPVTMITATPRFHEGVVCQPISSNEEAHAGAPHYPCCTFRGSAVALADAGNLSSIHDRP